jgi:ABC-2 type transport system ATP-binding protein
MTNIIEVKNLKKNFILPLSRKRVKVLDDLSFTVREGSVVGFLGANGAGKTTTLKIILQLIFQDSGSVEIFGKSNQDPAFRQQLGFLTERPYFYDYLTGYEFLKFSGDLFQNASGRGRIDSLLEEVGLTHAAHRPLRRYSKGMLQRIGIAQALINDPKLLILDEPMSGLDPDGRAEICRIIERSNKKGTTILFSSHLLPDVESLCDRVVIIDRGRLIAEDSVSALLERESKGYQLEFEKKDSRATVQLIFKTSDELQRGIDEMRSKGLRIMKVEMIKPSLEEVYLNLQKASR